jgi:hypothetical protein
MAPLAAAQLDPVFLKNFLPETLYLIEGEMMPAVNGDPVEVAEQAATISVPTQPAPVAAHPVQPDPEAPAVTHSAPVIPKLPKVEQAPVPKKFNVTGENRKGLVVLVTLPAVDFNALPQSEFLKRILAAIGFGPADVAFVNNVSGAVASFEDLCEMVQTNYIISFASRLDTILPHDKFTLYNPVLIGEVPVVFSQSLAVLDGDQEHKKLLWAALQRVFKK